MAVLPAPKAPLSQTITRSCYEPASRCGGYVPGAVAGQRAAKAWSPPSTVRWQAAPARLTLDHQVKHRFDVDDRGTVERFELADLDPQALDGEDLGPVHADRIGPVG